MDIEKYLGYIIWHKVSADTKKEFDSEPAYNKNFLKIKIKCHCDEVTDLYDKKFQSWTLNILVQH